MGTLTIRGLDDKVVENLKARARTRRHSLEAELREILSQAARQPLVLDPLAEADLRALLIQSSRQPLILDALAEADRIAAMTPREMPQTENLLLLQAGGAP